MAEIINLGGGSGDDGSALPLLLVAAAAAAAFIYFKKQNPAGAPLPVSQPVKPGGSVTTTPSPPAVQSNVNTGSMSAGQLAFLGIF